MMEQKSRYYIHNDIPYAEVTLIRGDKVVSVANPMPPNGIEIELSAYNTIIADKQIEANNIVKRGIEKLVQRGEEDRENLASAIEKLKELGLTDAEIKSLRSNLVL